MGGFSLGLKAIGGRCVFASEVSKLATHVFRANFPEAPPISGDIWGLDAATIPPHELLVLPRQHNSISIALCTG